MSDQTRLFEGLSDEAATHDLKTWPEPFAKVRAGLKPWELRFNDRDFKVGDILRLREWDPAQGEYSGEIEQHRVTWMLDGGFGLPEGYVIMTLSASTASPAEPSARPREAPNPSVEGLADALEAAKPLAWRVNWIDQGVNCHRTFDLEDQALTWAAKLPLYGNPVSAMEIVSLYPWCAPNPSVEEVNAELLEAAQRALQTLEHRGVAMLSAQPKLRTAISRALQLKADREGR